MAHELKVTAVYEEVEEGWTQARIAEIPEVITAAPTRAEAKELLADALREYLASLMATNREMTGSDSDREELLLALTAAPSGPESS